MFETASRLSTSEAVDDDVGPPRRGSRARSAGTWGGSWGDDGAEGNLGEKDGNDVSDLLSSEDVTLAELCGTAAGERLLCEDDRVGTRLLVRRLPFPRRSDRWLRVDEAADCCETERERGVGAVAVVDTEAESGAAPGATGVVAAAVGETDVVGVRVAVVGAVVRSVVVVVGDAVTVRGVGGDTEASSRSMAGDPSSGGGGRGEEASGERMPLARGTNPKM